MMKNYNGSILLICKLCILNLHAMYGQHTTFVNQKLVVNESFDKVEVYYDLIKPESRKSLHIGIEFLLDGKKLEVKGISGDIGPGISPGLNKKIIWDVKSDLRSLSGELKILLYEINSELDEPTKNLNLERNRPLIALHASISLVGTICSVGGIKLFNQSYLWFREIYEPRPYLIGNDEFQKYKIQFSKVSPLMIAGGAGLISAGLFGMGINFLKNKSSKKKSLEQTSFKFKPKINLINSGFQQNYQFNPSVGIIWKFP